jgi:cell division protein FtsQ
VSTIRANAAPKLAGNFFTTDLARDRRAFESVPWVRQAIVSACGRTGSRCGSRSTAGACGARDASADKLVNSYGEVFEANLGDVEDDSLPTLSGPDGSSATCCDARPPAAAVRAARRARRRAVAVGRGSWRVELDTAPRSSSAAAATTSCARAHAPLLRHAAQVLQRYERPLEYADLRHSDGYAVRLKGISTTLDVRKAAKK